MKYALVYDEVDTCRITVMVVKKKPKDYAMS